MATVVINVDLGKRCTKCGKTGVVNATGWCMVCIAKLIPKLKFPVRPRPRIRKCRVCGCTEDHACEGGCYWVELDLCSACEEQMFVEGKRP